jgi:negative regulator of flagellin synthesis FlgM
LRKNLNKLLKFFISQPLNVTNEKKIKEFDMAIEITNKINTFQTTKMPPKTGVEGDKKVVGNATETTDSVALTTASQEIKKAVGSSSAAPVDIDKVNSIKKALADGSYSINAEQVAKKLIQFEKPISQDN